MKKETFTREDGSKGATYSLEAGDKVISRFKSVGTSERAVNVKDKVSGKTKPVIIKNHFLGVTTGDGEEITLKITDGQRKNLSKVEDLTGKEIIAYEYKNDYGKQIGCKVNEVSKKTKKKSDEDNEDDE